jgi:prepilin peptidase CpaA
MDKALLRDVALACAAFFMLAGAFSDLRKLKIPNLLCLLLAVLFPVYVLVSPQEVAWAQHLMVAGIVLLIGFAMFTVKLLGAGDVKMLAAAALWVGPKLIATFLFITTIAGGVLAAVFVLAAVWRHMVTKKEALGEDMESLCPWHKTPVPYGVAIACGGVSALMVMAGVA